MSKFYFFAIFALILSAAPNAQAAHKSEDSGVAVATCSNDEATYEFFADAGGKIKYALEKVKRYPDSKIDCSPSRIKGELFDCKVEFESDDLTLYAGGYAIMHYNTDNDSNNDGNKAECTGSYFK